LPAARFAARRVALSGSAVLGRLAAIKSLLTLRVALQGADAAGARYVLVGVVVHQGNTLANGHYFSYCARPASGSPGSGSPTAAPASCDAAAGEAAHADEGTDGGTDGHEALPAGGSRQPLQSNKLRWFYASDSHVKAASWEQVAASEAYILIYVRV
jgi:hypothetical protein